MTRLLFAMCAVLCLHTYACHLTYFHFVSIYLSSFLSSHLISSSSSSPQTRTTELQSSYKYLYRLRSTMFSTLYWQQPLHALEKGVALCKCVSPIEKATCTCAPACTYICRILHTVHVPRQHHPQQCSCPRPHSLHAYHSMP